jgi:SEFIR domain/VHL beta domain
MPEAKRVFVSYSHESEEHAARVLAFGARLLKEGVDATVDQFTKEPAGGWPLWMEQQIEAADFVVMICTAIYRQRVEHPERTKAGAGVFWEANLVRNAIYASKGADTRFMPAYFGEDGEANILTLLQGGSRYQIDSAAGYEALYRRLTSQPKVVKPELGQLVVLPPRDPLPQETAPAEATEATATAESEASLTASLAFQRLVPLIHCDESGLKSLAGEIKTYIRFDNYLSKPLALYWINYEGERVFYGELQPGRPQLQETFATHPWVVAKTEANGGACVAIFEPKSYPGLAVIE